MCHEINAQRSFVMSMFDSETDPAGLRPIIVGNCTVPVNKKIPIRGDYVDVEYHNAYRGGSLTQTKYQRIRNDLKDAPEISQLIFKDTHESNEAYRPMPAIIDT